MRRIAFDAETGQSMPAAQIQTTSKEIKWKWIPRIRCHDCPGKLYTPGPEQTVESFLVHVKNRGHRFVCPLSPYQVRANKIYPQSTRGPEDEDWGGHDDGIGEFVT